MSSRVYYNEIDPRAVAWLRELMKAGAIPDGEIDTRSIVDVRPGDLAGFRQCHFFAGIGGWAYALRLAGWPAGREVWTGSCPCQPWSVAGKGEGADDPRHLWPAWFPLIRERRPATLFGEQTASKDGEFWLDLVLSQMEAIAYAIGAVNLPAAGAGAPHGRPRLWIVADDHGRGLASRTAPRLHDSGQPGDDALRCGADGRVADRARSGRAAEQPGASQRESAERGAAGDVADAGHAERGAIGGSSDVDDNRRDAGRPQARDDARARRAVRVVGDASRGGRRSRDSTPGRQAGDVADDASGMEHAAGAGSQRRLGLDSETEGDAAQRAGPTGGFWFPCDWIPCIDGKARPVEPGTFPLAHGIPARVGRLRGYGNAIVPQVAAEVIAAYLEVRP